MEKKLTEEMKQIIAGKIAAIKTTFDFNKVHELMTQMNWKWAGKTHAVPTVKELEETASELLRYTESSDVFPFTSASTGGLKATRMVWVHDSGVYSIEVNLVFEAVKG